MTEMYQLNQIHAKKQANRTLLYESKAQPDIEGDQGYPPHHVYSSEEVNATRQGNQAYIKENLVS
jgi:hypothetical protein